VWPDERVVRFVNENFLPARVHVKEDADAFQRYGEKYNAHWTPTVLQLDSNGEEQWRTEGFLPLDDFLGQLMLGRAQMDFKQGKWAEAEKRFREIVEKLPKSDAAPEALYWTGVSKYKASHDAGALRETAKAFTTRYKESSWAKKASIWA
jgi:TolA-binding protein